MNQTLPELILCGSIAIDRIMNFNGKFAEIIQPDKLHVLSLSVLLEQLVDTPGGIAANIAYSLGLLGESPVLLGSVGKSDQKYIQSLADLGINTTNVHFSSLPTASFNVITDQDDNQVGGFYPGAMNDADELDLTSWEGSDAVVVISAHDPSAMRRQVEQGKEHGLRLVYDVGQQVSNLPSADLQAGVDSAEVVIMNDYELGVLCKKINTTSDELAKKVPILITNFGGKGSRIEGAEVAVAIQIQAAKPSSVADPTGAGDAFRAGFLYGYLRQWNLETCGQLGAVTGSFAVEKHGTQAHSFTLSAVAQRYKDNFKQVLPLHHDSK